MVRILWEARVRVRVSVWGCIVVGGTPLGSTSARRGGEVVGGRSLGRGVQSN